MPNLPSLKSREVLKVLFARGFEKVRTSGSHIRLRKGSLYVTVPFHANKDIPVGTLRSIIRQADLTPEEFIKK